MAIKHVVTMGFIGSGTGLYFVPTLGYSIGAAVASAVTAPYFVEQSEVFVSGAFEAETFVSRADVSEAFTAGAFESEVKK